MDNLQPCNSDNITENVEAAIEAAGESRRSLADKSGIAYTTLDRRLKDGLTFTLLEIAKISDALNISPNELVSPFMFSNQKAS